MAEFILAPRSAFSTALTHAGAQIEPGGEAQTETGTPSQARSKVRVRPRDRREAATGVHITVRSEHRHILHISAREGHVPAVMSELGRVLGKDVTNAPSATFAAGVAVIGRAPGQWLAVLTGDGSSLIAGRLSSNLSDVAALTDLSSSFAHVTLSGQDVRDALAKGCAIDLHDSVFRTGCAALTQIDQFVCQIWQVEDAPVYDLLVARSLADSFWGWLMASCAAYGVDVLVET